MINGRKTKFAFLPTVVNTWRPSGTTAIIWMQRYYVRDGVALFYSLRGDVPQGYKWVNRLGFFSYEF